MTLHLTLTNDRPLTKLRNNSGLVNEQGMLLSFNHLMINAYRKKINYESLNKEIQAQLNLFIELMGYPPDYIDGHEHVQQLPIIRNAVVGIAETLSKNYLKNNFYVRIAKLPRSWLITKGIVYLRKFIISNFIIGLPGEATASLLDQKKISHNRFLLGYYDYKTVPFENIFRGYLTLKPLARDIFFCHPGYIDQKLRERDSVVDSRVDTIKFLKSPQYLEMMENFGINLNTFNEVSL